MKASELKMLWKLVKSGEDRPLSAADLALLLRGAMAAREKVGLKMNVPRAALPKILEVLPAEKSPTVNPLADPEWVAVEVIVEERVERELVPRLHRAGATGIISYALSKVIP